MMNVYVKTVKTATEILVAACDADIVGKTFEEDELQLEVNHDFYCGNAVSLEECDQFFGEATILNLVGENVVNKAITLGLVNARNVLRIGGTLHAQMVRL